MDRRGHGGWKQLKKLYEKAFLPDAGAARADAAGAAIDRDGRKQKTKQNSCLLRANLL